MGKVWHSKPPELNRWGKIDERWLEIPELDFVTIDPKDYWDYITFINIDIDAPRNEIEARLKERYKFCYQQYCDLGLVSSDWIGCGTHKQVFLLYGSNQVIKLFCNKIEWQDEQNINTIATKETQYILPHKYYSYYAVCHYVKPLTGVDQVYKLLDNNKIKNKKYVKRMLKQRHLRGRCDNFGFYEDNVVWLDIGDYE